MAELGRYDRWHYSDLLAEAWRRRLPIPSSSTCGQLVAILDEHDLQTDVD